MNYNPERKTVYISVDELLLLGDRSGSIAEADPVFDKPRQAAAMCDSAAEKYENAEQYFPASCRIKQKGICYAVTAEADLAIEGQDGLHLYAFASQGGRHEIDESFKARHARRLAAIAAVFALDRPDEEIHGMLILRYEPHKPEEHFRLEMTRAERIDGLQNLIRAASDLIAFEIERQEIRIPACEAAKFPFASKRQGQGDFMAETYRAMKGGHRLLCEAPTGIGKTVSALFPSMRAIGHRYIDKIFYFTPKTTAQAAAENALKKIASNSLAIRSISLTAKEKLCSYTPQQSETAQNPEDAPAVSTRKCETCPLSIGFYDRVRDAILWLFDKTRYITKEDVIEASKKYSVCPYELSLEVSEYCDVVICDYNYLFDPRVYLRRYFDTEHRFLSSCVKRPNYGVLIDEVHNLPERAKSMYSHVLSAERIRKLCTAFGQTDDEVNAGNAAFAVAERLASYRKELSENVQKTEKGEDYAFSVADTLDEEILKNAGEYVRLIDELRRKRINVTETAMDGYFDFKDFLAKAEWFSKRFRVIVERYNEKIYFRLLCLDAADILDTHLGVAKGAVLFSATVNPIDYYARILGCADAVQLTLPSPYEREKLMLTVFDRLSTRYVNREETAEIIAEIIYKTVSAQMGNYIVYFPSYHYLAQICGVFSAKHPEIATLVQSRNMNDWQRDRFIETFEPEPHRTLVGFCVLGGVFAEGIDLVGKRLIGSIIVGVGLPRVSLERDLLARYYCDQDEDGYLYSYVYPGMTRILQAVGRVIRTENDRGVALLLDDRFAEPRYKMLFPEHWRHAKFVEHTRTLDKLLSNFWEKENGG